MNKFEYAILFAIALLIASGIANESVYRGITVLILGGIFIRLAEVVNILLSTNSVVIKQLSELTFKISEKEINLKNIENELEIISEKLTGISEHYPPESEEF
jgi:hypothetical protein